MVYIRFINSLMNLYDMKHPQKRFKEFRANVQVYNYSNDKHGFICQYIISCSELILTISGSN